jgi:hypothetical protein
MEEIYGRHPDVAKENFRHNIWIGTNITLYLFQWKKILQYLFLTE